MEPERVDRSPARSLTESGLLLRQEDFCWHYTEYPDAARAARLAGYSQRYAKQTGYRLLRVPAIACRIREILIEEGIIQG